eukprot:1608295-Lingulodinium_polyedra.AAC.1
MEKAATPRQGGRAALLRGRCRLISKPWHGGQSVEGRCGPLPVPANARRLQDRAFLRAIAP